jgi:hypothetical protein
VFPVKYGLDLYMLFRRNSVFKCSSYLRKKGARSSNYRVSSAHSKVQINIIICGWYVAIGSVRVCLGVSNHVTNLHPREAAASKLDVV